MTLKTSFVAGSGQHINPEAIIRTFNLIRHKSWHGIVLAEQDLEEWVAAFMLLRLLGF